MRCRGGSATSAVREKKATARRSAPAGDLLPIDPPSSVLQPSGIHGAREENPKLSLVLAEVLQRYRTGPTDGVFTDGACSGNPGPGGWGTVFVKQNEILAQEYGDETQTTNNRMELTALIAGYQMITPEQTVTIWSDSQLCVNTVNLWAAKWEQNGWKRKDGPVKNLDLVRRLYELSRSRPKTTLRWIKAHNGSRWNEYVDALATSYLLR